MNAWYLGLVAHTLAQATKYTPLAAQIGPGLTARRNALSRPKIQVPSDSSDDVSPVDLGANGQQV